jgi:ribosomal RNA-processing protein 7
LNLKSIVRVRVQNQHSPNLIVGASDFSSFTSKSQSPEQIYSLCDILNTARRKTLHTAKMAPIQKLPIATTVNDFVVLPLRCPAVPSFPKETIHHLYIRANAPKVPTTDTPRELFLVNVPIDATETHIRSLFADQLGGARIENVAFESARVGKGITAPVAPARRKRKRDQNGEDGEEGEESAAQVGQLPATYDRSVHRSGSTAVATFVDRASAELALKEAKKAIKSNKTITWAAGVESKVSPLGSARYLSHHKLRYPSRHAFMSALSAQEIARARAQTRQRSAPDADGFITVGRGGKGDAAREEAARLKGEELAKRQKKMIGEDFYRFQVREKKKDEAKDLVRGFEEDRRKVEELRMRRGKARPE